MATTLATIETNHEDMIHDVQLDYYSKRLASASSDRTIKIFEVGENSNLLLAELKGHDGPVWQVAWAHPKFGSILASCSYDRRACIWRETSNNNWTKVYDYDKHESSVNSISWSPHEFGLNLACASSDGSISIISLKGDNSWEVQRINNAHAIGVNAISWSPSVTSNSNLTSSASSVVQQPQQSNSPMVKRIVTGGCDNLVKIWRYHENENSWKLEETLEYHTDWVRDVAWSNNFGLPLSTIASCSQDGTVVIWTQDGNNAWNKKVLPKFPDVVWRVSWSITGNILAVAGGDNKVTLWKESPLGGNTNETEWRCISSLDDQQDGSNVANQ